jgi:hypothetical protein
MVDAERKREYGERIGGFDEVPRDIFDHKKNARGL